MKHHILRTWDLVFLLMLALMLFVGGFLLGRNGVLALMLFVGGFLLGRNGGADGPPLSDALMQTESSAPATQESAPLLTPLTALMLFVGGFLLGRNGGADGPPLSDALMQTESSAPATQESAPLLTPLTGSDSTLPPQ